MMSSYIKFIILSLLFSMPLVSSAQVYPLAAYYAAYRNSQYQPASTQSMLLPENYMCNGLNIKSYCQNDNPFGGIQMGPYGASWGVPGLGVSVPYYQYWNNNPYTRNSANQTGCFQNSFGTASWYMPRVPCAYDRYRMQSLNKGKLYRTRSSRSRGSTSSRSTSRSSRSSSGGSSSSSSGSSETEYVPVTEDLIDITSGDDEVFMVPSDGCLPFIESYLRCSSNYRDRNYTSASQCREKTRNRANAEIGGNCVDQIDYAKRPGVRIKHLTDEGVTDVTGEAEKPVKKSQWCYFLGGDNCLGPEEETAELPEMRPTPEVTPEKETPKVVFGRARRPKALPEEIKPGKEDPQNPVLSKNTCMTPKEWAESEGGTCAICDVLKQRKPLKDRDQATINACTPEPASKYYHEAYKNEVACINNEEDARLHACIGESLKKSKDVMPENVLALFDSGKCEIGQSSTGYPGGKCYSEQVHAGIYNRLKQAALCLDMDVNMLYSVFSHESRLNLNILNAGDPSTGISQLTTLAIKDVIARARDFNFQKNDPPNQGSEPCRYKQAHFVNLLDSMKQSMVKDEDATARKFKCQLTEVGKRPAKANKSEFFADPAAKQIFIGAAYLETLATTYFDAEVRQCPEMQEYIKYQSPQKTRKVKETYALIGYNAGPEVAAKEMCSYFKYLKLNRVSLRGDGVNELVNSIRHTREDNIKAYKKANQEKRIMSLQEYQMAVSDKFENLASTTDWGKYIKKNKGTLTGRSDYLGAIKESANIMNHGGMKCSDY